MSDWAYYNEIDPYAADWLDFLIIDGHIAPGYVDRRSIVEVQPADLRGFKQCHFFAGIGGWSYALRLAGVPDNEPVWTGSCPCQPFSAAGKRKGAADERHLWPEMYRLIAACKPEQVFGEQVEAAVRLGWIDGVFADLAREDYACGFVVLGAHSIGAPHIRQRIYWMADALKCADKRSISRTNERSISPSDGCDNWVADSNGGIAGHRGLQPSGEHGQLTQDGCAGGWLADAEHAKRRSEREADGDAHGRDGFGRRGNTDGGMADTMLAGRPEWRPVTGERSSPWSGSIYIPCADGKARRVEPGIQPLAHGISARVGKLRAAGNAIVPSLASEFIQACQEVFK